MTLTRIELIDELRKYVNPAFFQAMCDHSTAELRALLAFRLSSKAEHKDARQYHKEPCKHVAHSGSVFGQPFVIVVEGKKKRGIFSL